MISSKGIPFQLAVGEPDLLPFTVGLRAGGWTNFCYVEHVSIARGQNERFR